MGAMAFGMAAILKFIVFFAIFSPKPKQNPGLNHI
jgi:hypothetical protein